MASRFRSVVRDIRTALTATEQPESLFSRSVEDLRQHVAKSNPEHGRLVEQLMSDYGISKITQLVIHLCALVDGSSSMPTEHEAILEIVLSYPTLSSGELCKIFLDCAENGYARSLRIIADKASGRCDNLVNCSVEDSEATPLMKASFCSSLSSVVFLLNNGALINKCDCDGRTALHYCVMNKKCDAEAQKSVFDHLVNNGCNISKTDKNGKTPVAMAILFGREHAVANHMGNYMDELQASLDSDRPTNGPSEDDYPPAQPEAFSVDLNDALADVPGVPGNAAFAPPAPLPTVDLVVNAQTEMAFKAVLHGQKESLCSILDAHPELVQTRINNKETLLMVAVKGLQPELVRCILDRKANPNVYFLDFVRPFLDDLREVRIEITALTLVARSSKKCDEMIAIARLLLKNGCDLSFGKVLSFAIDRNHTELVELIMKNSQWKRALLDVVYEKKTPLKLLLKKMPDIVHQILDKLVVVAPTASIVSIDVDLLDQSFIVGKVAVDFTFVQRVLQNDHETENQTRSDILMHATSRLYIFEKWREQRMHYMYSFNFLFYFCLLASFTVYYFTTPKLKDFLDILRTNNITFHEMTCVHIESIPDLFHIGEVQAGSVTETARMIFWWLALMEFGKEVIEVCFRYVLCSCETLSWYRVKRNLRSTHAAENVFFEWPFAILAYLYSVNFCLLDTKIRLFWQRQCAALAFILGWIVLLLLARKIPYFEKLGLYLRIFTIMVSTLKSFFFMFLFSTIGFSLSFFVLFENLDPFSSWTRSFVKTLMIMVGEATFDEIFVNTPPNEMYFYEHLAYSIFVLFALTMMIMMLSLFIGLITIDMEKITDRAEYELTKMKGNLVGEAISLISALKKYIPFTCWLKSKESERKVIKYEFKELPNDLVCDLKKLQKKLSV